MNTRRRLEALEQRARKPVRVADSLRVLLTADEVTADDMTLVVRFHPALARALLDDDDDQHPA